MRRKIFSIILIITLLSGFLFVLTGCESGKNGKKGSKLADVVEIGDYVDYDANSGLSNEKTYTTSEKITGSSKKSTYSSSDSIKWRVLSVDKASGKVELIAEKNLSELYLGGITGYLNAENILNDIGAIYGYGKGAAGGRSLNIEDIEKYSNYDKYERNYSGTNYGETATYTSGTFIKGDGIEGGIDSSSDSRLVEASINNPVKVKRTYYEFNELRDHFENQNAYDVLLSNRGYFWLASRCVSVSDYRCWFCVYRQVGVGNGFAATALVDSENYGSEDHAHVVPVVSLKSNIKINGKNESGEWILKVD